MTRSQRLILAAYVVGFVVTYGAVWESAGAGTKTLGDQACASFFVSMIWPIYWPCYWSVQLWRMV